MLENILFDLGGVLLTIDAGKTRSAFASLGWQEKDWMGISGNGHLIFENLETGMHSPAQFREEVRKILPTNPTDSEIDHAWNAMLIDFPPEIVDYLVKLRNSYKLYLLSNTNELHLQRFGKIFGQTFGYPISRLFEKCYYSHEIGFRKPDPEAFTAVIKDASLDPGKTLFVDDLKNNIETAESLGMMTLHIEPGTLMERLPGYLTSLAPSTHRSL